MAQPVRIALPEGFHYLPDFLSTIEERALLEQMERLSFRAVEMRGMVAKRRVSRFGWLYGYESWDVTPGPPVPDRIMPLRDRVAALIGVPAAQVEQTLVS